jgi:hypothetical protein
MCSYRNQRYECLDFAIIRNYMISHFESRILDLSFFDFPSPDTFPLPLACPPVVFAATTGSGAFGFGSASHFPPVALATVSVKTLP